MSDPRNAAHDKKVNQEKEHEEHKAGAESKAEAPPVEVAEHVPGDLEKSVAVLSKLKEMEFHSRANIETLAGLMLTIDDELKQKEFSDSIGELYGAQDAFQTKATALIENYGAMCDGLKPTA